MNLAKNLKENSVISTISLIRHMYNLVRNDNKNPYKFENHGCFFFGTGFTRLIKHLVGKNENPYAFPNHFNVVLFDTGYFSIKDVNGWIGQMKRRERLFI
jgi:hypothetical protein